MQADLSSGQPMILMGDLNHNPTPPEYPLWLAAGWVDTFTRKGDGKGLTFKSDEPYSRLDYVMAAGPSAFIMRAVASTIPS